MRRRQGFTLVELLVAMALIIFIMAILSEAFVPATGTFRNLKASGDLAEKLRATTQLLQRDLAHDHFEGKKRLSNPNFWVNGPPEQGYFQIWQSSTGASEGTDLAGVQSFVSADTRLAFTIKTRGNQMGDFLSAMPGAVAANTNFGPLEARYQTSAATYNYQWAEVAWFLSVQGDMTAPDPTNGGSPVPLYVLYRRQRLAVPDNSLIGTTAYSAATYAQCLELSCWNNGGNLYFNSPSDLTVPGRRFGGGPTNNGTMGGNPSTFTTIAQDLGALGQSNPTLAGADIQLANVVSFDVRVLPLYPAGTSPANAVDPFTTLNLAPFTSFANGNPNYPGAAVFDTWSSVNDGLLTFPGYANWSSAGAATSLPMWTSTALAYTAGYPNPSTLGGSAASIALTGSGPIIQAIQISIRIWDTKTNQTRQVTIVQAM